MKILVADDSPTNLALISAALKQLDHEVIATNNGEEAIAAFRQVHPDLIILDVVMQVMNGFECAKKIRELEPTDWIPIIFLSASVDDESIAQGIDAGGDDYLTKPFSQITLAAKIKAMQRISDMRKDLYDATCKLTLLSSTDPLTGVYNRLQFNTSLAEKIAYAKRHDVLLALLFIDLDNFKFINDHYGHHIGDLLLIDIANRLKVNIREYDFIARLGGDEFAIMLYDIKTPESSGAVAKNILTSLAHEFEIEQHLFHISCSIGIACFPFAGTDAISLVKNADIAMYHAKEAGRNNFKYFTQQLLDEQQQQDILREDLKIAIEKQQLFFVFNPVFELNTKQLSGLEAILQWQHPVFGLINPEVFYPLADEIGLNETLDKWILQALCTQSRAWHLLGYEFKIILPLAYRHLLDKNFVKNINEILNVTQLPPNLLELEIESKEKISPSLQKNIESVFEFLCKLGIKIGVDNFDLGYPDLMNLHTLPINTITINQHFIQDITTNKNSAAIIKSIGILGKNLDLVIRAKGIENDEQLQLLINFGCTEGQGNFLHDAVTAEGVHTVFSSSSTIQATGKK